MIATGAARIFYRNAINFGLPVLICADTSQLIDGRMVQVDIDAGVVTDSGDQVRATVTGTALAVVPGVPVPRIVQSVQGPVETFRADTP